MSSPINTIPMEYDNINSGKFLSQDSIVLNLEQRHRAAKRSQTLAAHPRNQWQIYLEILARLGTLEWLHQRAPELMREPEFLAHSIEQLTPPIDQLQIGHFKLNLVVTDDSIDPEVRVTRTLLENSNRPDEFYVLVEVLEDLAVTESSEEQVNISILGYLPVHQINQHNPIILNEELALLSTDWFELNPDQLLLYLRCLEPEAVSLQVSDVRNQSEVVPLQPELTQTVVNVGNWLRAQANQIVEELSWMLLPSLAYGDVFRDARSPMELFTDVAAQLRNRAQLVIPLTARTAYRDFTWSEINLRLFVTTWEVETNTSEWSLLLLLAAQPGSRLPQGTQLQVRDELQVLEDPILSDPTQEYLYTRVIGDYNEQFFVTINFPNATAVTLPPFTFMK
ncbi:MAG: DUF1822 family protein [Microcoleaceae cyanobacterium]